MVRRIPISLLLGGCVVLAGAYSPALAGTIGLAWNPSVGASGYKVYYGPTPGSYTDWIDVGNVTRTEVSGLGDCTDWYFAVTAYNVAGESGFSEEVFSWPRIEVRSLTPNSVRQGNQFTMTFDGANFDPALQWDVEFEPTPCPAGSAAPEDCWIYHLDPPTVSCNRIEVLQTVEPLAEGVRPAKAGTYTVTLVTTDGSDRSPSRNFRVEVDPERFNVNRSDETTGNRIDGKDMVWFSRLHGQCDPEIHGTGLCSPSQFDADYDFDGDGFVDGQDLMYLVQSSLSVFGGCWNGTSWTVSACPTGLR